MTSEKCNLCGARNWTIYRTGNTLTIRCGFCDGLAWDARILDLCGRILP